MPKEKKEKSFNKLEYDNKFHKENYVRLCVRFRKTSDSDVIEKLNSVPNKADYIRQLVLDDIAKTKQNWNLSLWFLKVYSIDSDSLKNINYTCKEE